MRSLLLRLVLVVALLPTKTFANAVLEKDTTTQDTGRAANTDKLTDQPAPWEVKGDGAVAVSPVLPKEKSNAALYGWAIAVLAAAGMTVFIWRSNKNAS